MLPKQRFVLNDATAGPIKRAVRRRPRFGALSQPTSRPCSTNSGSHKPAASRFTNRRPGPDCQRRPAALACTRSAVARQGRWPRHARSASTPPAASADAPRSAAAAPPRLVHPPKNLPQTRKGAAWRGAQTRRLYRSAGEHFRSEDRVPCRVLFCRLNPLRTRHGMGWYGRLSTGEDVPAAACRRK